MLLQIGALVITHLVVPAVFLIWLWRGPSRSKLDWLIKLFVVALYSVYIFLIGRWDWLSYYLRFVLIVLLLIASFKSYKEVRQMPFHSARKVTDWLSLGVNFFVLILFAVFNVLVLQGYSFNEKPVQLSFPLKNGTYYVAHGGNSSIINYHNVSRAQRYALDIVELNIFGTRAEGIYPKQLTKYAILEDTIYSPCNGRVKSAMNRLPDLIPPEMNRENPAGNHVLIECNGVEIIVAHMMSGSVSVKEGAFVKEGQAIGKVGNSGNTSEPHLHLHARKVGTGNSFLGGEGVPMVFNDRFLVRNSLIH